MASPPNHFTTPPPYHLTTSPPHHLRLTHGVDPPRSHQRHSHHGTFVPLVPRGLVQQAAAGVAQPALAGPRTTLRPRRARPRCADRRPAPPTARPSRLLRRRDRPGLRGGTGAGLYAAR